MNVNQKLTKKCNGLSNAIVSDLKEFNSFNVFAIYSKSYKIDRLIIII